MPSVKSCLVQDRMSGEFSTDILHRKGFDVNMRLFRSNSRYRSIVLDIIKYMGNLVDKEYDDYPKLSGISGANIGIPLNIIGVRATDNTTAGGQSLQEGVFFFMINPRVVKESTTEHDSMTNCGSLRLQERIKVRRPSKVDVVFCDLSGKERRARFTGPMASTIQHEIDHNSGVLITDKEVKE